MWPNLFFGAGVWCGRSPIKFVILIILKYGAYVSFALLVIGNVCNRFSR